MRRLLYVLLGVLLATAQLFAQNRTVTGTVSDNTGQPLPDVSVRVSGTNTGTVTDKNGSFSISVAPNARSLEFSYVGFTAQTVSIPAQGNLTVSLVPTSNSELNTVVVTGYTRVKRSQYSGSATKITSDKVNFVPNASFDQILQGKAPGLLVTVGSGQPGTSAKVQIRGASSISGGNGPLFVIDGMPVEAGVFQSINPNDFESVDVLRDAVATAQYGNRGANGVIVATTKKGRAGRSTISYNGQAGITQPGTQQFSMMNSAEILRYQEILGTQQGTSLPGWRYSRRNPANAGLPAATLTQYDRILDSLRNINTDWQDVFQRTGSFQSHDLNLSGGYGNTRYFLSGGFYDEDGIGLRSDLTRYTVRANLDTKTDKVSFAFNSTAGYTDRNFIESEGGIFLANPFAAAYLGLPYQTLINPNTNSIDTGSGKTGANAYSRIFGTSSKSGQLKLLSSMSLNYDITKTLSIGGFAGIDYRTTTTERSVYPGTYAANSSAFPAGPRTPPGYGSGSYGNTNTSFLQYITRVNAGYHKIFSELHDVDVQLISEYTRERERTFGYTGYGIDPKRLNTPAAITPGTATNLLIPTVAGSKTGRALYAAMALARYTFDGKYTLNASFRRDGSSQLPEKNRFQNFYSAGISWNTLREGFAQEWKSVSDLRVRLSYGTSANADGFVFGNFGYLPLYGAGTFAGQQTIIPSNAGNEALTWERIGTLNLGVDFGFFANRLYGTADVYNKRGYDVIVSQKLPLETGFRTQDINAATVRNRGAELSLTGEIIKRNNFSWSIGGNVAYNKNEVTDLGQVNEFEQGTEIVRVGLPIGSHYITRWGGVDQATGAPLYYKKDGTLTNAYSDDDRVADFGTYNAPWIGGFNTALRFKGFTLDGLFTFQEGFQRFNNQDFFQLNHAFAIQGFNLRTEMLNMWQTPGQVTDIQSSLYVRQFTSKDIQDASFIRFRTLTLAYNFGANILDRTRVLSGARIFVQGQNLYTWTKWSGFDPEDDNNLASYEYPTPRTFTVGLNVTFK